MFLECLAADNRWLRVAAQVKTITALTVAALAEAAAPYGIESFDDVLEPLWKGIRLLRGKVLASFLKVGSPPP